MNPSTRIVLPLLVFLGLAGLTAAQDLAQKVTLSLDAQPAVKALQQLTAKTGVVLRTSNQTDDQILLIDVKDKPLSELMNRIAQAAGAEWSKESDGYRLIRGGALAQKQVGAELAERIKLLTEAIERQFGEVSKTPTIDRAAAQSYLQQMRSSMEVVINSASTGRVNVGQAMHRGTDLSSKSPAGRAIAQILKRMSVADLAALAPNTRTVFATNPTRMQRNLPGGIEQILNQFIAENRTLNEAAAESGAQGGLPLLGVTSQSISNGRPAKTILVVSRVSVSGMLSLQLTVADSNGQTLASGFSALAPSAQGPIASFKGTGQGDVELTELSKQFAKLVKNGQGAMGGLFTAVSGGGDQVFTISRSGEPAAAVQLTKDWRERILKPESYEPLSTVPNDIIRSIAKANSSDIVAWIPDASLLGSSRAVADSPLQIVNAVRMAQEEWGFEIVSDAGWLIASPRLKATSLAQQVNRTGLGKMLRALDGKGWLTLDELAAFAVSQPAVVAPFAFDSLYARLVNPAFADRELARTLRGQREMLRFYATLGGNQRQALNAGRPIPIAGLSSDQSAIVRSMVFNSQDGPRIQQQNPQGGQREERTIRIANGMMMGSANLREERTEVLGNGIPTNAFLSMRTDRQQAVFASTSGVSGGSAMTAREMGMQQAMSSRTGLPVTVANQNRYDRYLLGTQVDYDFTFQLGQQATLNRTLSDNIFDAQAQGVAFDSLPGRFRTEVANAAKQGVERAIRLPARAGQRGTSPPPPPPPAP